MNTAMSYETVISGTVIFFLFIFVTICFHRMIESFPLLFHHLLFLKERSSLCWDFLLVLLSLKEMNCQTGDLFELSKDPEILERCHCRYLS